MLRALLVWGLLASSLRADERSEAANHLVDPWRSPSGSLSGVPSGPGCVIGVIENGAFVYQAAFGQADLDSGAPINSATVFNVASLSKQFTAAALYLVAQSGKVRLADSVRRFLPELPAYAENMTVADLLHHTSGLRDITPLLEVGGHLNQAPDPMASLRLLARQSALNFAPGSDYEYTNSDYLLLGLIVERSSGRRLADFAEEQIFRPLGMSHTAFHTAQPAGQPAVQTAGRASGYMWRGGQFRRVPFPLLVAGDGGLNTSLDDLLRWDQNLYSGALGGRAFLDFMQSRGTLATGQRIPYAAGLIAARYRGVPYIGHAGRAPGFRAEMIRFPSRQLTTACLCNRGDADASDLARRIARVYLAPRVRPPPHAADLDYPSTAFPALDGVWESKQGWIVRAWSSVDGLWISLPEGDLKLQPLNRRQLFTEEGSQRLLLTELTPDRIELAWEGAPPVVYNRLAFKLPRKPDFSAYEGEYYSPDADARYRLIAQGGELVVTTGDGWRLPVVTVGSDRFLLGPWAMRFLRDPEGAVEALELHRARLWSLRFEKVR